MSRFSDHGPPAPQGSPLPAELETVDAMLAGHARRQAVPPGLVERVFDASVGLLPSPRRRAHPSWTPGPLRFPTAWWGRLALAASIGLAFVVAVRTMPLGSPELPPLTHEVELALLDYAGGQEFVLTLGDLQPQLGEVDSLLMTRDMRFRDLAGDLESLAAKLEM